MAESFTPNLGLTQIGTGDLVNAWGPVESTNKGIVDNAVAGMISINLPAQTGYPIVALSFTQGSSTQQLPNRRIVFTGALAANTTVLFPQGRNFDFDVENSTTGAFSLTLGVNNNSGGILGAAVAVPQGQTMALYSDGTNIVPDGNAVGGNLTVNGNLTPTGTVNAGTDVQVNGVSVQLPSGIMLPFAGPTSAVPTGWLYCDGSAVSRTTYATLFGVIGTTFGSGDGSTTFNLPDTRGRVVAGNDSATGRLNASGQFTNASPGATGGEAAHTLAVGEMPSHAHTASTSVSVIDPGHSHVYSNSGVSSAAGGPGTPIATPGGANSTNAALTSITATASTALTNTGGGGAHNTVQPTLVVNYIIKT
jgi:microcystin-dependent protein